MASSPRAAARAREWKDEDMEFVKRKNFTAETQRVAEGRRAWLWCSSLRVEI
jgi:hypothetical protein